ncbi:MAG: class GN sortase [Sedimenticola sp.]|jgi:sortase A|nr:MAG: class GN sortase [Sedimenticola sp.]
MKRPVNLIRTVLPLLLLLFSGWHLGQGMYIEAKAWLAQVLLQQAWSDTLTGEQQVRPWPWADTWPVARLRQPRLSVDQIVLAGASGRTLAFGPGHLFGSAQPGGSGQSVISGHRDTHFRFLQDLRIGDRIELTTRQGDVLQYAVYQREVTHEDDTQVLYREGRDLTLITCYPFDAIVPGGSQRFVVSAAPVIL